jgi:hypothetical protein
MLIHNGFICTYRGEVSKRTCLGVLGTCLASLKQLAMCTVTCTFRIPHRNGPSLGFKNAGDRKCKANKEFMALTSKGENP